MYLFNKFDFFFLLCFILFANEKTAAQNTYRVIYDFKRDDFNSGVSSDGALLKISAGEVRLLCNDSISFSFLGTHCNANDDISLYNKLGRSRYILAPAHHLYLTYLNHKTLTTVRYFPAVNKKYLVLDTPVIKNWVIDSKVKYFMGYQCQEAYSLGVSGDTLYAFFTKDIPFPGGPIPDTWGLPGLVLEAYDTERGQYYIATKIEIINYAMQLPPDKMILSRKEYENRDR